MRYRKLFLLDAYNLLYRAHYALGNANLQNKKGMETGVCYGFTRMLIKLLKEYNPEYLGIAFDSKEKTIRKKAFEDYKKDRPPMPEPIRNQLSWVRKIIEGYRLNILEKPGYEADDLIGTVAGKFADQGYQVIIVSGDKDLLQLISSNVSVLFIRKGISDLEHYGPGEVKEKYGVEPAKIPDLLAIMGDKSDNIPGIPGVGPVTAVKLIKQFGDVETLLENIDQVKNKSVRKKLEAYEKDLPLWKYLAEIRTDVEMDVATQTLKVRKAASDELRNVFMELDFRNLLDELNVPLLKKDADYRVIDSAEGLHSLRKKLDEAEYFSIDTETTSTDAVSADLVGISISIQENAAFYIPVGHKKVEKQLSIEEVTAVLKPVLENERTGKIGHNIKYDLHVLKRAGLTIKNVIFDTMLASYLLEPERRRHNLDDLTLDRLNAQKTSIKELIGTGKKQICMDETSIKAAAEYAGEDSDATLRLYNIYKEELSEEGLMGLFQELELPLIEVLRGMEETGVKVDPVILEELSKELELEIGKLEKEIYMLAGEEFNLNSSKQMSHILYEKLNMPTDGIRKTVHGWSTDEKALSKLASMSYFHGLIPKKVLEYRNFAKLKSTYVDSLLSLINERTGRIHTTYNQAVAETGRLSSSSPNLQNIPIRGEWGSKIRRVFIPGTSDALLMSADYSQMELRILAHMSEDAVMMKNFKSDADIHAATASELFGTPLDEVDVEERRKAKTVNFGIDYGMTAYGLSQRLGIPVIEAQHYIDRYFERFSGVKEFIEKTVRKATETGYVETLMGRKRRIPELQSERSNVFEMGKRRAINMPVQGTAADIIKKAMIEIDAELKKRGMRSRIIMQVHDELVFELPENEADDLKEIVVEIMESAVKLSIPLKVDVRAGKNWDEAH